MTQFAIRVAETLGPCQEWTGSRLPKGYGRTKDRRYAHRVAFEDAYGPIAPGLLVLHRCDNPPCVRPSHLFLGTAADNTADMMAKGRNGTRARPERIARGELCHTAKLTVEDVRTIRTVYSPGRHSATNSARLAGVYGVDKGTICRLVRGQSWAHVA